MAEASGSAAGHADRRRFDAVATVLVAAAALGVLSFVGLVWFAVLSGRPVLGFGLRLGPVTAGAPWPDGSVVATLAEHCPYPWQEYLPAEGRFVIGAGSGGALNVDANGILLGVHRVGETGGQAGVELSLAEIPPHTHRLTIAEVPAGYDRLVAFGVGAPAARRLGLIALFSM